MTSIVLFALCCLASVDGGPTPSHAAQAPADGGIAAPAREATPSQARDDTLTPGVGNETRGAEASAPPDARDHARAPVDGGIALVDGGNAEVDAGPRDAERARVDDEAADGGAGGVAAPHDAGPGADAMRFMEEAFVTRSGRAPVAESDEAPTDGGIVDGGLADEPQRTSRVAPSIPISATLVLVLVFAFFVTRVLQRMFGDRLLSSGVEYLFVGFLMGPHVLGFLARDALSQLMPVVSLLLGFAGLLLGLRLRGPRGGRGVTTMGVVTALLIALAMALVFSVGVPFVAPSLVEGRLTMALTVGAAAAAISSTAIVGGAEFFRARGPLKDLLESAAQAGNVVAVVVAGVTLAMDRALEGTEVLLPESARFVGASVALGVGSGILFRIFVGREREGTTLFLATIALLTFASGMAAGIGVSPLFLNFVAGVVVSVLMSDTHSLVDKLRPLEQPALATFAIFAGAMWFVDGLSLLVLPVVYAATRRALLPVATTVARAVVPGAPRTPRFAHGLFVQGGFAVAIAVNYAQVRPEHASLMLTTVLVALLAQDVLGIGTLRRLFGDQGELGTADVLSTTVKRTKSGAGDAR